jgi:hypothetical protein
MADELALRSNLLLLIETAHRLDAIPAVRRGRFNKIPLADRMAPVGDPALTILAMLILRAVTRGSSSFVAVSRNIKQQGRFADSVLIQPGLGSRKFSMIRKEGGKFKGPSYLSFQRSRQARDR